MADSNNGQNYNILHDYANYTYKISLLSFKSIAAYNSLVDNATWKYMFDNVSTLCDLLITSGGSPLKGSEFYPAKHPLFDLDFYISQMTTGAIISMNNTTRATNVYELQMQIVEPIGTTLLERFAELLSNGTAPWTEQPLLVQIDFLGYDEAGDPQRIVPATRWIPIRLAKMDFNITSSGTTYIMDFICQAVLEPRNNPMVHQLNSKSIKGGTVQELLDNLAREYNLEQEELSNDRAVATSPHSDFVVARKKQEYPDRIKFDIIDPEIKDAILPPNVAQQTSLTGHSFNNGAGTLPPRTLIEKRKEQIQYFGLEPNVRVEQTQPGQSMQAVVEKILRDSTYITNQLNETNSTESALLKDPSNGLDWWKITYAKKIQDGKFDNIRRQYAQDVTIQIEKYKSGDTTAAGYDIPAPGSGKIRAPARIYDYIYTGKNLDILELDLTFQKAFIQAMTGSYGDLKNKGSNEAKVQTGRHLADGTYSDVVRFDGDYRSIIAEYAGAKTVDDTHMRDLYATDKQEVAGTLLENLYRNALADMVLVKMSIVGDPCYFQQDGVLAMTAANKAAYQFPDVGLDQENGALLSDLDDSYVKLNFITPRDIDEGTGLTDMTSGDFKGSNLSGNYRVWSISSSFAGGEFTQQLTMTRLNHKKRDAVLETAASEDAYNDILDDSKFKFEDLKVQNISFSPGTANAVDVAEFDPAVTYDEFGDISQTDSALSTSTTSSSLTVVNPAEARRDLIAAAEERLISAEYQIARIRQAARPLTPETQAALDALIAKAKKERQIMGILETQEGITGTNQPVSMAGYSNEDVDKVNNLQNQIKDIRKDLVVEGVFGEGETTQAIQQLNELDKQIEDVHTKYGNEYNTFAETGYLQSGSSADLDFS